MEQRKTQPTDVLALIDADAIIWIIGYNHRDTLVPEAMRSAAEDLLRVMLTKVRANYYLGAFSGKSFRHNQYKYQQYKGNRKEKPDWFYKAEEVIEPHLCTEWGFDKFSTFEADDIISIVAELERNTSSGRYVICSPDKDLRQVPGLHYDYTKETNEVIGVTEEQAEFNLLLQMLTGDDTDNVAGVPGLGDVKAKKLLAETDPIMHKMVVRNAYCRYFGSYYGNIIHDETLATLQLLSTRHPLYHLYYPVQVPTGVWDFSKIIRPFNHLTTGTSSPFELLSH